MSILFALRGTSKTPIFSGGVSVQTEIGSNSVDSGAATGVIGNSVINLDQGAYGQHALIYPGPLNIPTGQQFSILMRVAVGLTGQSGGQGPQLFSIALPCNVYGFQSRFSGAASIVSTLLDSAGATNTTQTLSFSYATATYYDLVWLLDTSLTTAGLILYKDGTSVASTNIATRNAFPSLNGSFIALGCQNASAQNSTQIKINEFVIWNTIIDPTNVALTGGNGSLNGASRTQFVSATAFNGDDTDPGTTNVKTGTAYNFGGAAKTGTYDGSDRWTDPGIANVRLSTAYKANATSNNRTGTAAIPSPNDVRLGTNVDATTGLLNLPATTDVKSGVTYDQATKTGSYVATCDYPATNKVVSGTVYASGTKTGTFTCSVVGGSGTATWLVEKTRALIVTQIQNNLAAELAAIRSTRSDNTISSEIVPLQSYYIFDGAHTYQCPAIFVVADSVEIPDERLGTNYVNAVMKIFVSAVVEGADESSLTIRSERYQAALFHILHQTTITDLTNNVKIYILCKRLQFSRLYTKDKKAENMSDFRKEVSIELEVKHWENPTS